MTKPTFAQMEEFFRQVASGKITDSTLQLFLEGLRRDKPLSMADYAGMIKHLRCHHTDCNGFHSLGHYAHIGGWSVAEYSAKQWLYTICHSCQKETSLRDWGIPIDVVRRY